MTIYFYPRHSNDGILVLQGCNMYPHSYARILENMQGTLTVWGTPAGRYVVVA